MSVLSVALAAWGTFVLLRLVVVPRADAWADANRDINGVRAAAMSSLSGFLSFASLMVAISTTVASGVLTYVSATGGITLQEARDALGRIELIDAFFGNFDAGIGIAMTIALIAALAYHAYRSGGKRLTDALNEQIARELSRLQGQDLEELPPTEDMATLAAMIEALQGQLAGLDEKDAASDQLRAQLNEFVQQYHTLDLLRRIDTSLDEPATVEESGFGRVLLFFSSVGMLRSLKGLGRVTATVGLLLLLPASMTIGLPQIQDATEARLLSLNETVERLELELDRDSVDREYESLMVDAEPEALTPDDEQAIDEIASIFESEVVHTRFLQGARALRASAQVARSIARARARNDILEASGSHPKAQSQSVRSSPIELLEQRVLALNAEATGRRQPVTSYGEQLRADLRDAVPRMDRAVWAEVRTGVGDYVRSFQQAPNPRDVRAMMLSDVLGHVIGGVDADGPVEKLLQRGAVEFTGELAEAAYRTESRRFMVALAQSQDVSQALSSLSRAPRPMPSAAMTQMRLSVENIPAPEEISVRPSSLSVIPRSEVDEAAAQRAVQRIAQIRGTTSASAADALLVFGDLFPGQPNEPVNSVRGRAVSKLSPSVSGASLQAGYARARNYKRLRGFSRIGGVILGRPPQSGTSLEAEKLEWTVTDRDVVLRLILADGSRRELGRYDPAIVHNALAYAADGRVTTVTMVTAEPLDDLRILLHPALVDTGLGCSAIRLDQLADEASVLNQSLGDLRETAIADVYGEHAAYVRAWGVRMLQLSDLQSTKRHYEEVGDSLLLRERATQITDSDDGIAPELPATSFDFLLSSPEFYDERLVNAIRQCGSSESVGVFDDCIRATATADVYESDTSASWAAPYPQFVPWSGVREQPWVVDNGLAFMRSDQPLGPFRFIVQIAFTSPPWFISEAEWYAESNPALESFDDETPYELTAVGNALMDEIASRARRQEADTAEVLSRVAEFTHLQRLFRAVLDDHLELPGMDLGELAGLASQTAESVNRADTLRWLPKHFPSPELMEEVVSRSETQSEAPDLLSQVVALRTSLGLKDQEALAVRLGKSGCPTPGRE